MVQFIDGVRGARLGAEPDLPPGAGRVRRRELGRDDDEAARRTREVAHDLRLPLAAAAGHAELLLQMIGPRLTEQEQATMATLLYSIVRMDAVIERTLLAPMTHCPPEYTTVDVDAQVADVLAFHADLLEQLGAETHVGHLGVVWGEPFQLSRVFQNIIGNAVRYRDRSRRLVIRIRAWTEGDERVFTIADNGVGFGCAGDGRMHLDRFGLGLRICRRIVDQHGGRIWVDSHGVGAIVGVALPASRP